jgi:hypothetical protein
MWGKRFPLRPRSGDELDVWAQVCVRLSAPLPSADSEGPPMVGYFQNFGIRMSGPQPKTFLERLIWTEQLIGTRPKYVKSSLRRSVETCVAAQLCPTKMVFGTVAAACTFRKVTVLALPNRSIERTSSFPEFGANEPRAVA